MIHVVNCDFYKKGNQVSNLDLWFGAMMFASELEEMHRIFILDCPVLLWVRDSVDLYAPNFEKVGSILVSACMYVCMYVCMSSMEK